jgi:hypothetical protein
VSAFGGFGLLSKGFGLIAGATTKIAQVAAEAVNQSIIANEDGDNDDDSDDQEESDEDEDAINPCVALPWECPTVVLFVVGGISPTEVASVRARVASLHASRKEAVLRDEASNVKVKLELAVAETDLQEAVKAWEAKVEEEEEVKKEMMEKEDIANTTAAAADSGSEDEEEDDGGSESDDGSAGGSTATIKMNSAMLGSGGGGSGGGGSGGGSGGSGGGVDKEENTAVKAARRRLKVLRRKLRPKRKPIPRLVLGGSCLSSPEGLLEKICM